MKFKYLQYMYAYVCIYVYICIYRCVCVQFIIESFYHQVGRLSGDLQNAIGVDIERHLREAAATLTSDSAEETGCDVSRHPGP